MELSGSSQSTSEENIEEQQRIEDRRACESELNSYLEAPLEKWNIKNIAETSQNDIISYWNVSSFLPLASLIVLTKIALVS